MKKRVRVGGMVLRYNHFVMFTVDTLFAPKQPA